MGFRPSAQQMRGFIAAHFPNFKERESARGTILKICNPFDDDHRFKMGVLVSYAKLKDFRGDARWAKNDNTSFLNFVMLYLKCTYQEAITELNKFGTSDKSYGFHPRPKDPEPEPDESKMSLPHGAEPIDVNSELMHHVIAFRWLKKRGFTSETVVDYKIMVCGMNILFPYYNEFDELVYWQQRSTANKFFEYPDAAVYTVGKADFIYNIDKIDTHLPINVFESITNTLTIGRQAVATGSADISPKQMRKLISLCKSKKIVLSFDRDKAGINAMVKVYKELAANDIEVSYAIPPYTISKAGIAITDWNELYTDMKPTWLFPKIRECFKSSIKPLNIIEATQLQLMRL